MHTCEERHSSLISTGIEVSGLGYAVGGVEILRGVDARIPEGDITAVVGPSGAGKSSLPRAINRLIEPSSGEVYLDGEPTSALDPLLWRRVGMVFQIPTLFGAPGHRAHPEDRTPACPHPPHRRNKDNGNNLSAGCDGRHDHCRRRPARSCATPDSRSLHASWERLHRRNTGRDALVPFVVHTTTPAQDHALRTLATQN
jgi:hypothetical protein